MLVIYCYLMATFLVFSESTITCPENEYYGCRREPERCKRWCENRPYFRSGENKFCHQICMGKECTCNFGYLRNGTDGRCIWKEDCP